MNEKKRTLFIAAFFGLLSAYFVLPLFLKLRWWGVRDWDQFCTMAAIPSGTILQYGQFPFWNPYIGGGNIFFHHPEAATFSPFLLLYMLFGALVGLKIQVFICYFLGLFGSWRLFERLGMSPVAAMISSAAYFGSVFFSLHFAEGHMSFTHFCFAPWFIYYVMQDRPGYRGIVMASLMLSLMILGSGAGVPLLYTLLFCSLFFILRAVEGRKLSELIRLALSVAGGLALSAVKFLPMCIYVFQNEWTGNPNESIPLSALPAVFFAWNHTLYATGFEGQVWDWHEYGAYLSPPLVILAVVALAVRFRKLWPWLALTLFFLLYGLGDFGWFSPWALLSKLPGYSSARCTGRSFQYVILSVAVLGGFGFDYLRRRLANTGWGRIPMILLYSAASIIVVNNLIFAWPIMSDAARNPGEEITRSAVFEHVIDDQAMTYRNFLANRGSLIAPKISLYEPSRALVGPGDKVSYEHFLNGSARVNRRLFTPNKIEYDLFASGPGVMVISMGFDRGWSAADGRPLRKTNGLITFDFSRGNDRIVLNYETPFFRTGLVLSLLTLAGLVLAWRRSEAANLDRG